MTLNDNPIGEESEPASRWWEEDDEEEVGTSFKDYEIISSPNDFNVKTVCDYIEQGVIVIPDFQRNYVWDMKRASKLIESLLIGLPIPQIFLYEESRNRFLVVDGQQRLMSIYYFSRERFPRKEKRGKIRAIYADRGGIPQDVLGDDEYFVKFNLTLPARERDQESKFNKRNYSTLGEDRHYLDMRPMRCVVIKQVAPQNDDDSSVFEIFNRLNTGGVNLKQQEIRASLYHSTFMRMLAKSNNNKVWRRLLNLPDPDLQAKDIEILLRSVAMLFDGERYKEPLAKFLNAFSKRAKKLSDDDVSYVETLISAFFQSLTEIRSDAFLTKAKRFNIGAFEAVFRASCADAFAARSLDVLPVEQEKLAALRSDPDFIKATQFGTGQVAYVKSRYERARAILGA